MDKAPPTQAADTSSNKISRDSNYGSLITESSSSCLSLLSESDLFDDPSTSGCSEMASMMQSREKKRQKVKAFLRELKSMVPHQSSGSKLGTLSTLDFVVSSMRKIAEEQKQDKSQIFKAPSSEPVALPSLQCPESVDFRNVNDGIILNTQSELTVAVSLKNHVVLHTSPALMDLLGYPQAWWKGRLLKDFVHKKDIMTVNSYINSESTEAIDTSTTDPRNPLKKTDSPKQHKQFFYARIRRFRSLSSGFSIPSTGSYMFFKVMVTSKSPENAPEVTAEEQKTSKRCMMLYFAPLTSPYKDGQLPPEPEQRTFSLRHSLFCTYNYTHANTVALLGFLPQDIVGTSIFDYYHPEDLPQLLDIYKRVMHSMGQPFKSGTLRIRTRNGTYVKVTTEWSSFMNPWDHKLEFIIAQHTIIKPPDNPNVFEEAPDDRRPADGKMSEVSRKLMEKIREALQKSLSTLDTAPLTPSDSGVAVGSPQNAGSSTPTRDADKTKEKGKNDGTQGPTSSSDVSSSLMDEKSISSLYNQVNYSLNIKKFLLSHPKAFPVSDEDSSTDLVQNNDSEEDLNEEEEMQVEIPVLRPPSCGSSTQVHVSEQGFHEEVPSPPSFSGEDPSLTRDTIDNPTVLTQDSLRKHTKAQELLYLQEASKEQPHLFNMKSRRPVGQRGRQKRSRLSGPEETTDVFKFACNSKGQRGPGRGGGGGATNATPGLFMPNFPITAVDIKPTQTQTANTGMSTQAPSVVGMVQGPFQQGMGVGGMGVMPQLTVLPIDPNTGMHLQPHLQPFLPTPGSNMQWPYYPQSGYSLLPQVMAGFYQPVLQPVPIRPGGQPTRFTNPATRPSDSPMRRPFNQPPTPMQAYCHLVIHPSGSYVSCPSAHGQGQSHSDSSQYSADSKKNGTDSDNHMSSADDTSSSIQYLLDNFSSPNEETDEKIRRRMWPQINKMPGRRQTVPPWLQTVNWTPELRLMYKMPVATVKSVLKKDREALKKMVQPKHIKEHLETLLEEADNRIHPPMDEEADYIFFPDTRNDDGVHTSSEGEGEKTPTVTSTTIVFEMGPKNGDSDMPCSLSLAKEEQQHDLDLSNDLAKDSEHDKPEEKDPSDQSVEVIMTESLLVKTPVEPLHISQTLEKALSPASEGSSNISGKEGSAVEEEGVGRVGVREGEEVGGTSSPTMYTLEVASGPKSSSSERKDASSDDGRSDIGSRSDVGSDKCSENSSNNSQQQKNEDSQSTFSKASSNLTPSEERTTEESGSSMKESDMSTPKGSCASSNDKMSSDSGAESASTPTPDILEKLFVPLKVRMCHNISASGDSKVTPLPFWQQEACMSQHVAMQYNMQPLDLSTILANDRRRLSDMKQPQQVSCQLLELLQEMENQTHKNLNNRGDTAASSCSTTGPTQMETSESAPTPDTSGSVAGKVEAQLMQPPSMTFKSSDSHRKSRVGGSLLKDSCSTSSASSPPQQPFMGALPSRDVNSQSPVCQGGVEKQLLDKLHSMTPGQRSEDWPGDVIVNKVFLPVDLVGTHNGAAENAGRSQDTELLDAVD